MTITDANQLIFSTLKIIDNNNGSGTGFIVDCDWEDGKFNQFLVTNKHITNDSTYGKIVFPVKEQGIYTLGRDIAGCLPEDIWKNWIGHPDRNIDIAILNITPIIDQLHEAGKDPTGLGIDLNHIPDRHLHNDLKIGEAVIYVGYPHGYRDKPYSLPVARVGTIATIPSIDYDGSPTFLIDGSIFPGSSGSPVYINRDGQYRLLGIISGGYRPEVALNSKEWMDLGLVYKSHTVRELICHLSETRKDLIE